MAKFWKVGLVVRFRVPISIASYKESSSRRTSKVKKMGATENAQPENAGLENDGPC